jgi:enoyl-CoA hydratase
VGECLGRLSDLVPEASLQTSRYWIDQCYTAGTVEDVLYRLETSGIAEAKETATEIGRKSPTCVKVAFESLRRARRMASLEEELAQEFRVSLRCFAAPDLAEGIRAQVVDKDREPRWKPASLDEVSQDQVESYFAPLDGSEGPEWEVDQ